MRKIEIDKTVEQLNTNIGAEDFQEIIINKEVHIHVRYSADGGYTFDFYKESALNEPLEDDFLTSVAFTRDDLLTLVYAAPKGAKETSTDYYLLGSKLMKCGTTGEDELMVTDADEHSIINEIEKEEGAEITALELESNEIDIEEYK